MNIQRFVLGLAALMVAAVAEAEVRLPAFFGDNMVLQQQTDARLWGWATPDKKVTVTPSWNHKSYTTRADKEGRWKIEIPTPEAGGPYEVTISDGETLKVGTPYVEGAKVTLAVIAPNKKGPKVINFKAKRRKGARRKVGHRQQYTVAKVKAIA